MNDPHELDKIFRHLGDFGKFQFWQFFLHVLSAITAGVHMLSLVTVAAVPDHRCEIPQIDTNATIDNLNITHLSSYIPLTTDGTLENCFLLNHIDNTSMACTSWIYNTTYHKSSRAIEWNLVCGRRWMGALAQTMFMLGVFTGAITLGNMSDKFGRKPIFCISAILQLIIGVLVAFSPEYLSFIFLRFLYGIFGSAGSYITGFVLTMELVGPSKRSICGIAFQVAFALGIMLVAGWGVIIEDRFLLQIIYGLHGLLLLPHYWLMEESPRWLWSQNRCKEAMAIMQKALKQNGKEIITEDVIQCIVKDSQLNDDVKEHSEAGLFDLFKTTNLRKKTLNVCLAWFANSLVYYGLSLNTGNLNGNPYLILFIMGLIELPSYAITVYLMDLWGRRVLVVFNMIAGGICCIMAAVISPGTQITIVFVMIGKFLIASSFALIYNYSAELFPTVIRNSALGLGSMCARISSALTPLITLLDSFDPTLPSIIFAVTAIISGGLVTLLPETLNKPMPQTIEDGEMFGNGDTCFSVNKKKYPKNGTNNGEIEYLKQ